MNEMIERVARAIFTSVASGRSHRTWESLPKSHQEPYLTDARAAIAAMREPIEEMIDVAGFNHGAGDVLPLWQDMIDAALGDNK